MNNIDYENVEVLEIKVQLEDIPKPPIFNEKKEKKSIKTILIGLILVLIIFIGFGLFYFLKFAKENTEEQIKEVKVIELGTKKEEVKEKGCKLNLDNVNFEKTGKYDCSAICDKKKYELKIEIVDTTSPQLVLKTLNIKPNENASAMDFVIALYDLNEYDVEFHNININEINKSEGIYIVPIKASDKAGNVTIENGILVISNILADKFLVASKLQKTDYDATLKVVDKIGFNSSNYYINALRIYEYSFNSKEEYKNIKKDFGTNENVKFDDNALKITQVKLLTKEDLDVLNGNFPSTYNEITKLYFNLGYKNKIE